MASSMAASHCPATISALLQRGEGGGPRQKFDRHVTKAGIPGLASGAQPVATCQRSRAGRTISAHLDLTVWNNLVLTSVLGATTPMWDCTSAAECRQPPRPLGVGGPRTRATSTSPLPCRKIFHSCCISTPLYDSTAWVAQKATQQR